jgi:predicted  nucleic acid-binding Zn-ribbon protein
VAALHNGACGACFRALPPAALQEARRRERLLSCDGCGRFLMLPPE